MTTYRLHEPRGGEKDLIQTLLALWMDNGENLESAEFHKSTDAVTIAVKFGGDAKRLYLADRLTGEELDRALYDEINEERDKPFRDHGGDHGKL